MEKKKKKIVFVVNLGWIEVSISPEESQNLVDS